MKPQPIEIFEGFVSTFPRGILYEPQIRVICGSYKGLIIDLWYSAIVCIRSIDDSDNKLDYKYSIVQIWDSIPESQFDGLKIVLKPEDQEFLHILVQNYIMKLNKTNKIRNKR